MTFERTQREGRFGDLERGQGILTGFQDTTKDPIDKKFIKRQLKPFKKFGVPQNLSKLKGMTDTELERLAAKAVIKNRGVKVNKLRTNVNVQKFGKQNIIRGRKIIAKRKAGLTVNPKAAKRTRAARRHILNIRENRRIMKTPLF